MDQDDSNDPREPEMVNKATMDAPQEEFIDDRGTRAAAPQSDDKDHGAEVQVEWAPDPPYSN